MKKREKKFFILFFIVNCLLLHITKSKNDMFNKVMSFLFDATIKKSYTKKGYKRFSFPFYASIGKYRLCVYAMNMDWHSMRIKIEKDGSIWLVIKKGEY